MSMTTTNNNNYNSESDHDKLIRIEQILANNYKNTSDMNKTTSDNIIEIRNSIQKLTTLVDAQHNVIDSRLRELEDFKNNYITEAQARNKRSGQIIAIIASLSSIIAVLIVLFLNVLINHKL